MEGLVDLLAPPIERERVVISPFVHRRGGVLDVQITLEPYADDDVHYPSTVTLHVYIVENPDMTLEAVRNLARERAKQQLAAAFELLDDDPAG